MKRMMVRTRLLAGLVAGAILLSPGSLLAKDAPKRPNILLIVADDLGFSDIGAFGGEIETPNLDALALRGVRFTNFYTAPTCSPTRAMLLTGKDAHAVGLGTMAEALPMMPQVQGRPGYEGHLDPRAATIAEQLGASGYRTMMAGKWHLGLAPQFDPAKRGFQQSYAMLQGAADHFGGDQDGSFGALSATYTENGAPTHYPVGRFSGDYLTERMIGFLNHKPQDHRPFFAYMAFTEPHFPLQAPADLVAKYKSRYDAGPAMLRVKRLDRMKALGLLDAHILGARLETLDDWSALSPDKRAIASRAMEIYAAMVESLDINVGKLLAALRKSGDLDNTVIIFMSDNGAAGTSQAEMDGALKMMGTATEKVAAIASANVDPEQMGHPGSYVAYGSQWAQAAMAPFHLYKGSTDDGGVRTPAFASGPGIKGQRVVNGVLSVRDIMPTVLALAQVPAQPISPPVAPLDDGDILPTGKSWAPILAGYSDGVRSARDAVAWELFYRRGIRIGNWKAVFRGDNGSMFGVKPSADWTWHLFDLDKDPGESEDVSAKNPQMLDRLVAAWRAYASENGVVYTP